MPLGSALTGLLCLLFFLATRRRLGTIPALAIAGFLWSLMVIACVTLIPAQGAPWWRRRRAG